MKWHRDKFGHIFDESGQEVSFRSLSILCSASDERIDQAERNTDLIASAPQLLDMLERIASTHQFELDDNMLNEAVKLIAAAKGQ